MSTTAQRTDPVIWIVLGLVLLLVVPGALMMGFWGFGMMGSGWMGTGTFGWGWGIAAAVGLVAVFAVLYFLVKAIQAIPPRPTAPSAYGPSYPPPPTGPAPSDSRAILDARYAKGEITREQYLRMRADLEGRAH